MNHFKLITLTFIFISSAYAKCLTDIYSVGASGDSLAFESQRNGENVKIASDYGLGFKIGQIIFCPKEKLELNPYIRGRFFQFAQNTNPAIDIERSNFLLSLGLDTRLMRTKSFEWLADIEMRQEYYLTELDGKAVNDKYLNLKMALGLRATLFSDAKADYNIVLKYGGLIPISDRGAVSTGSVYEIDLEYFKRMAKNYSIRADLYFSELNQSISDIGTQRLELGARLNYIFRY